jgi:uroporphyrin-III C-methyltransferase/precorrin-2 dehydrogenase/sirohydrochlorin ferrochelatase
MDQFMPAFPLKGTKIVVIGTDDAALNKLRLFRTAPCDLVWLTLGEPFQAPIDLNPKTLVITDTRIKRHLKGAQFVFIGLEDEAKALKLAGQARRFGALVNVVDNIDQCDFYTPALIDRGAVTIAFSTGGAAPILARDLRSAIEGAVPRGVGLLASAARDLRDHVKTHFEGDSVETRRRFWERALRGKAARIADSGDFEGTQDAILEELRPEASKVGRVHLVGAGPGDPELLTIKAARLIRDADVIVHDRLVSPEIIDRVRRDALRIDVGKKAGNHTVPQDEIGQILIEQAKLGRNVVRLKGGDSLIFGRGGEEVDVVRAAGIEVDVTPGISAALAAGAQAQIPLTHRDDAQAVTFVTGRPKTGGPELDYQSLAAATHTVVVYMGVATAGAFTRRLIAAGRNSETPVALIENASLETERKVFSTLGNAAADIKSASLTGPAVIVIGEVVNRAPRTLDTLSRSALKQEQAA